ncbi:MAG: DUF5667 domain-containing protein [Candidatus Paceibacterota bacterium]
MKNTETTKYFKDVANVRLDPEVNKKMRTELSEYADYHTVEGGVRITDTERSIKNIQHTSVWSSLLTYIQSRQTTMKATLLIALLIGSGGTAAAAHNALPGDMLYPVKIHVNENVRSAVAVGANAEARLQASLLEERIEEAQKLAAQGKLEGEMATQTEVRINAQARLASETAAQADTELAASLRANLVTTLEQMKDTMVAQSETIRGESASRLTASIDSAISIFGTELTAGVDMDSQIENASARALSLRSLISAHTEIEAETRSELRADIDAAESFIAEAQSSAAAKSEEAAQMSIDAATNLLGGVESQLSLMGDIEIDSSTGAITDIDLYGSGGTSSETDTSVEVETQSNSSVDTKVIDVEAGTATESSATSNINLGL